jgi:carboxyl-terminal processing protease
LCTSDLGDDDNSVQIALQRAARSPATASATPRPRAALDEPAWSQLRHSCPARQGDHLIDVKVAKRLLADPLLYSQAAHAITSSPSLAAAPVASADAPAALTGDGRALSSGQQ